MQRCGKLIFHQNRHRRSKLRWLVGSGVDGFACGLKQLGGHRFCTHRACGLAWGTSRSAHIEQLPRKALNRPAASMFCRV
jgi:hypothetical protein